jgi:hypothetical protein
VRRAGKLKTLYVIMRKISQIGVTTRKCILRTLDQKLARTAWLAGT